MHSLKLTGMQARLSFPVYPRQTFWTKLFVDIKPNLKIHQQVKTKSVKYLNFQLLSFIHFTALNCSSKDLTSIALRNTTNMIFKKLGIQIHINTSNSQELSSS